ncbi:hypothetical protein ACU4GD_07705 [Cupriavidus basilensis]
MRQLRDVKLSPEIELMDIELFSEFAALQWLGAGAGPCQGQRDGAGDQRLPWQQRCDGRCIAGVFKRVCGSRSSVTMTCLSPLAALAAWRRVRMQTWRRISASKAPEGARSSRLSSCAACRSRSR